MVLEVIDGLSLGQLLQQLVCLCDLRPMAIFEFNLAHNLVAEYKVQEDILVRCVQLIFKADDVNLIIWHFVQNLVYFDNLTDLVHVYLCIDHVFDPKCIEVDIFTTAPYLNILVSFRLNIVGDSKNV